MREIKFRGIKKGKNHFVYGNLSIKFDMAFIQIYLEDTRSYEDVEVAPETVGQFTGLTDKNGQKIFEGDIVKCHAIETTEVVIVEDIRKIPVQFKWVDIYNGATIKIIGNIHDNPELLT